MRIAAVYKISHVRDTLLNSLAKFTTLDTVREMMPKNIECIKMLITIALTDGDYLGNSWAPVLECISQLARLHLLSSGLDTDDMFFSNPSEDMDGSNDSSTSDNSSSTGGGAIRRKSKLGHGTSFQKKKTSEAARQAYKFFYGPSRADQARQIEQSNAEQVMGHT